MSPDKSGLRQNSRFYYTRNVWLQLKREDPLGVCHWRGLPTSLKLCRLILQNESRYIQYRQSSKNDLCFSSNDSLVQYLQQFWATWLQPDKMMIFCRKKISQSSPSRPAMSFFIFSHILFTMVDPYTKHGQRFK